MVMQRLGVNARRNEVLSYRQSSPTHITPGLCPGLRTLRLVQPYRLVVACDRFVQTLPYRLVVACDRFVPGYPQRSCSTLNQREAQQGTVLQTVLPIRLTPGLCPGLRTLRLVQPYRLVIACDRFVQTLPYRLVTACDRLAPGYPQRSVRSGISL